MKDGISVILCCHNSTGKLQPTLEHLQNQKGVNPDEWEIILVDNSSTDNTAVFAQEIWNKNPCPPQFHIIAEPTPGLANARKKGISEANFKYLLFCDDDNWLNSAYVATALNIMRQNPRIGILGGYGLPVFEGPEPPFFWQNQFHALAVGPQYEEEGDITNSRSVVYGAGMVVNYEAYQKLVTDYKFEFQTSGRTGKSMASSEDHELCLALKMIGYRIYWTKELQFEHFIPQGRTTLEYYKKLYFGFGISYPYLIGYGLKEKSIKNDYRYIAGRNIKNIFRLYIKLLFEGYYFANYREKYRYLNIVQSLQTNKGSLWTTLRMKNKIRDRFIRSQLFNLKQQA